MNEHAAHAADAVAAYLKAGHGDPESMEDTLTDLLADLRHWAESAGVAFDRCTERAAWHHSCEVEGDEFEAPSL